MEARESVILGNFIPTVIRCSVETNNYGHPGNGIFLG